MGGAENVILFGPITIYVCLNRANSWGKCAGGKA